MHEIVFDKIINNSEIYIILDEIILENLNLEQSLSTIGCSLAIKLKDFANLDFIRKNSIFLIELTNDIFNHTISNQPNYNLFLKILLLHTTFIAKIFELINEDSSLITNINKHRKYLLDIIEGYSINNQILLNEKQRKLLYAENISYESFIILNDFYRIINSNIENSELFNIHYNNLKSIIDICLLERNKEFKLAYQNCLLTNMFYQYLNFENTQQYIQQQTINSDKYFKYFAESLINFVDTFTIISEKLPKTNKILNDFREDPTPILKELISQTDIQNTLMHGIFDPFNDIKEKMETKETNFNINDHIITSSLNYLDTNTQTYAPKFVHQIWVGSIFDEQNPFYYKTLSSGENLKNAGWNVFLWVDRDYGNEINKFREYGIQLLNINTLNIFAKSDNLIKELLEIAYLLLQVYPKNYGEISDVLRYIILHLFKGMYCDIDDDPFYIATIISEELRENPDSIPFNEDKFVLFFQTPINTYNSNVSLNFSTSTATLSIMKKIKENYQPLKAKYINYWQNHQQIYPSFVGRGMLMAGSSMLCELFNLSEGNPYPNKDERVLFIDVGLLNSCTTWQEKKYTYNINTNIPKNEVIKNIILTIFLELHLLGNLFLHKYKYYLRQRKDKNLIMMIITEYLIHYTESFDIRNKIEKFRIYKTSNWQDICNKIGINLDPRIYHQTRDDYIIRQLSQLYTLENHNQKILSKSSLDELHKFIKKIIIKDSALKIYHKFNDIRLYQTDIIRERGIAGAIDFYGYFCDINFIIKIHNLQNTIPLLDNFNNLFIKILSSSDITEVEKINTTKSIINSLLNDNLFYYCSDLSNYIQENIINRHLRTYLNTTIDNIYKATYLESEEEEEVE